MKKTILTIAMLAVALGAQAAPQAAPQANPAAVAAPAAASQATVSVTGATTVAGAPLLLAVDGGKASEPTFQALFDAGQAHPKWTVTAVKTFGEKARMSLKSTTGRASLEMDVATGLVAGLKIGKGSAIEIETQSSGQGALIKFMKDKTPLGFMVNQGTSVAQPKVG